MDQVSRGLFVNQSAGDWRFLRWPVRAPRKREAIETGLPPLLRFSEPQGISRDRLQETPTGNPARLVACARPLSAPFVAYRLV
jgi:hypothetical protein